MYPRVNMYLVISLCIYNNFCTTLLVVISENIQLKIQVLLVRLM